MNERIGVCSQTARKIHMRITRKTEKEEDRKCEFVNERKEKMQMTKKMKIQSGRGGSRVGLSIF